MHGRQRDGGRRVAHHRERSQGDERQHTEGVYEQAPLAKGLSGEGVVLARGDGRHAEHEPAKECHMRMRVHGVRKRLTPLETAGGVGDAVRNQSPLSSVAPSDTAAQRAASAAAVALG